MLESLPFPKNLKDVPRFAGEYQENRDSQGFLRADCSLQTHMIALAESFELLTSSNHPNRPRHTLSAALQKMSQKDGGPLETELFKLFVSEDVFQRFAERYLPAHLVDAVDKESLS